LLVDAGRPEAEASGYLDAKAKAKAKAKAEAEGRATTRARAKAGSLLRSE
jgi:hypothetical protein